ncbi:hypothetical protein ACVW1C_005108 [Bradyrhizobium sp. USDA 4011]
MLRQLLCHRIVGGHDKPKLLTKFRRTEILEIPPQSVMLGPDPINAKNQSGSLSTGHPHQSCASFLNRHRPSQRRTKEIGDGLENSAAFIGRDEKDSHVFGVRRTPHHLSRSRLLLPTSGAPSITSQCCLDDCRALRGNRKSLTNGRIGSSQAPLSSSTYASDAPRTACIQTFGFDPMRVLTAFFTSCSAALAPAVTHGTPPRRPFLSAGPSR